MSAAPAGTGWSLARAEAHLRGLEQFGMRLGLQRMRRLLDALGSPQERLDAIHVVGTNGKSSTVRMTAALLEAHGRRTGAFLSPHLTSFAERIRIGDEDVAPDAFGAAVERAAAAAAGGARAAGAAGRGGRHDATNVLDAPVVVLTNVGLEHTRWLGTTVPAIAREKLAVVRPGATLVLGGTDPEVEVLARATGARVLRPGAGPDVLPGFQRANFAAAAAAAGAWLGTVDPGRVAAVAARVTVPGRLQVIGEAPLTVLDGAHNPSGIAALAATLPDRPWTGVVGILDDKDAGGMLAALASRCPRLVCTTAPSPRALTAEALAGLARAHGAEAEAVEDPRAALARGRALAGPDGAVLVCGSLALVGELVSAPGERTASAL